VDDSPVPSDSSIDLDAAIDPDAPIDPEAAIDLDAPGGPPAAPRRSRRRWYWAGCAALLLGAVAVAVAGIGPGNAPHPPPPAPPPPSTGPMGWVEALVDGAARGALAGDPAFAKDLPARITEILHGTGDYPVDLYGIDKRWHPDQEVRLLFADDVGTRRVVLVAMRLPTQEAPPDPLIALEGLPGPETAGNRTKVLWFTGPRGSSVSSLLSYFTNSPDAGVLVSTMPAAPFIENTISTDGGASAIGSLGLAPPGCIVSAASSTDLGTFVSEPTGSYIVRTGATTRPEYWRVTCGGTVREQVPAPVSYYVPVTPEQIQAVLAGATNLLPGDFQLTSVQDVVAGSLLTLQQRRSELTAAPRVSWAGVPQMDPGPAPIQQPFMVVVTAPAAQSGWFVAASLWDVSIGNGTMLGSALVRTSTDPSTAVVAALLQVGDQTDVFVLSPPAANGLRLQSGTGSVVRNVALVSPAAVLALPSDPVGLVIQAYDETSKPVGAPARVSPADAGPDTVSDWSGRPDAG
jgi:hypothetical protein